MSPSLSIFFLEGMPCTIHEFTDEQTAAGNGGKPGIEYPLKAGLPASFRINSSANLSISYVLIPGLMIASNL